MTVPSYTEDLTDIATADEDPAVALWTEFSTNQQGSASGEDADYPYIQGSFAITQTCSKSKTLGNLGFDYGSTISLPTDGAFLVWQSFSSPFAIDDYAGTSTGTAGMSVLVGQNTSNFDVWYVGGKDKSPMPYGGWQCHAVNTTVTRDAVGAGTKSSDQVVGSQVALTAYPSKGEVHQIDVLRFGRCSAKFEHGEVGDYADIAGFAALNDNQSNRWGLIQEVSGGYLWQGLMSLGTSANAVDFRDSNVTIFIKWTPKVTENFNTIEVLNTGSNIVMTGFQFINLDPTTTASKGRWITTDDAPVAITNCIFNDMDVFEFDSKHTVLGSSFTRCNQITQNGATINGNTISNATSAVSILVDDLDLIDNCIFTSDGSNHAMELTSAHAAGEYTLTGCTYSDYASANGSTGNEVVFNDSGGHVIINVDGGDSPTYRNGSGATTAVNNPKFFNFTTSPSITGYEWRLYEVTALGSLAGSVELYGEELATADNQQYAYNYVSDKSVGLQIIGKENDTVESITYYTLGNTTQSVTILLTGDDNN